MKKKKVNEIKKTVVELNLVILLLIIFVFASANSVFAVSSKECGCPADNVYLQDAPNTQIVGETVSRTDKDLKYYLSDIAGYVWSIITPDEALADTPITDCLDDCKDGRVSDKYDEPCCEKWNNPAVSKDCKKEWSCNKIKKDKKDKKDKEDKE